LKEELISKLRMAKQNQMLRNALIQKD
jgi:hypothetical protein